MFLIILYLIHYADKSIETDERNVLRIILNCLPVDETMLYFVPYLFNLLELRNDFVGVYDEDGNFNFPSVRKCIYILISLIKCEM